MTNFEFLKDQPEPVIAALQCQLFKCETCPFARYKPEFENMNCIQYWFRQERQDYNQKDVRLFNDTNTESPPESV